MKCPSCGTDDDKVLESRAVRGGAAIRRRRICNACSHRFTTYEEILRDSLMVVKRDGRLEEFSRAKLTSGLQRALAKRPVSVAEVEHLVDRIIEDLETRFELEVPSKAIGDCVMAELMKLDEVAYVRFASIYRHFADIEQFMRELRGLQKPPSDGDAPATLQPEPKE